MIKHDGTFAIATIKKIMAICMVAVTVISGTFVTIPAEATMVKQTWVGKKYIKKKNRYFTAFNYTGRKGKGDLWYAKISGHTLEVYGSFMSGNPHEDPEVGKTTNLSYKKYYFKLSSDYEMDDPENGGALSVSSFNSHYKKRKKTYKSPETIAAYAGLTFSTDSKGNVINIVCAQVG